MIYNKKYIQTYLMRVGEQRYVGHTELTLKRRLSAHRTAAKMKGFNTKLHVALRAADYECTISRIEGGMYETREQARENEGLWIKNYDTINNGLNSYRAITTKEEKLKFNKENKERTKEDTRERMSKEIECWNCSKMVRRWSMRDHRRSDACLYCVLTDNPLNK
jgi:hypothetical protein